MKISVSAKREEIVTGLAVKATRTGIYLTWESNRLDAVYYIERDGKLIDMTRDLVYIDNDIGLTPNVTYTYRIRPMVGDIYHLASDYFPVTKGPETVSFVEVSRGVTLGAEPNGAWTQIDARTVPIEGPSWCVINYSFVIDCADNALELRWLVNNEIYQTIPAGGMRYLPLSGQFTASGESFVVALEVKAVSTVTLTELQGGLVAVPM